MNFRKVILFLLFNIAASHLQAQGFYKDLFWDAGVGLDTSYIPVFQSLEMSMEFSKCDKESLQRTLIVGNGYDNNGVLLYPDNSPRFKTLYTPGGDSRLHGHSLGEDGRNRIRTFVENGGSYVGVCGGAAIISLSREPGVIWDDYYHIWPGFVKQVRQAPLYPDIIVPKNCDLLQFRSFGEDLRIDSVMFTFGSYPVEENKSLPEGTRILLRFDSPDLPLHKKGACWSYKKGEKYGTVVVINSHPEIDSSGKRLALMESIFLYALNGYGSPQLKGILKKNKTRNMDKETIENDPDYTKIGDKQYHHFKVNIPENTQNFTVIIDGEDGFDFNIYLKKGDFAFSCNAEFSDTSPGSGKKFNVKNLPGGEWFISVECASIVESMKSRYFYKYKNNIELLNGIEYRITANWE